jgi:uncharacterized membrane protein YfbV (UPF0208 family)
MNVLRLAGGKNILKQRIDPRFFPPASLRTFIVTMMTAMRGVVARAMMMAMTGVISTGGKNILKQRIDPRCSILFYEITTQLQQTIPIMLLVEKNGTSRIDSLLQYVFPAGQPQNIHRDDDDCDER